MRAGPTPSQTAGASTRKRRESGDNDDEADEVVVVVEQVTSRAAPAIVTLRPRFERSLKRMTNDASNIRHNESRNVTAARVTCRDIWGS